MHARAADRRTIGSVLLLLLVAACTPAVRASGPAPVTVRIVTAPALSDAEKLYGLSKLWKEVDYNFAFFDQVPGLDWDATYRRFIPRVLATRNSCEYYRELQRFLVLLADGHTGLDELPPDVRAECAVAFPWIRLEEVQQRAIVADVGASLADRVPLGSEVLTVDGATVEAHLREHVFPFVSSSTEHIRWSAGIRGNSYFGYGLLAGPAGSVARLTIRSPDEVLHEVHVARDLGVTGDQWLRPPVRRQLVEYRELEAGTAYVALNGFGRERAVDDFEDILPLLLGAERLVIDLRHNSGGNTSIARQILQHLTRTRLIGPAWRTREHVAARRAWGRFAEEGGFFAAQAPYYTGDAWLRSPPDTLVPSPGPKIDAPLVVLIGHNTASAAEDFLVYLDGSGRALLVGEPTFGSTGQPLLIDLPGGGVARVVTKRDTFADGRDFVGYGIQPDILVEPSVDDVREGRDPVLERALEVLRSMPRTSGLRRLAHVGSREAPVSPGEASTP